MKKLKTLILYFLTKLFYRHKYIFDPQKPRILIVSTTGLGDSLWATPTFFAIKEKYPNCFLAVLTSIIGKEVFTNNSLVDEIFILDKPFLRFIISLIKNLRKEKFQVIIIYHSSQRITLPICSLIGASMIIGTKKNNKGLDKLLTKKIDRKKEHEIKHRFRLIKEINISKENYPIYFNPFFSSKQKTHSFLSPFIHKIKIVIHPGAANSYKCWNKDLFIRLVNLLSQDANVHIFITGYGKEKAIIEEIKDKANKKTTLIYNWPLHDLGALFSQMDLIISNDTGPAHLTIGVEGKLLVLFSPTDPLLFGPYCYAKAKVLSNKPCCNPCLKRKCLDPFCWYQISPEKVYKSALELLKKN